MELGWLVSDCVMDRNLILGQPFVGFVVSPSRRSWQCDCLSSIKVWLFDRGSREAQAQVCQRGSGEVHEVLKATFSSFSLWTFPALSLVHISPWRMWILLMFFSLKNDLLWSSLLFPLQTFVPSADSGHRPSHLLSAHPRWTQLYLQIWRWELL